MSKAAWFFWCNSLIVAASLLTGLRVLPGPDVLGILLAFYSLIVLPGIIVWRLAGIEVEAGVAGVCRVFLTGLAVACGVVCVGFVPGASYPHVASVYGGLLVAGLLADLLRSRVSIRPADVIASGEDGSAGGGRLLPLALMVLFVLCCVLFYGSGETGTFTDAPDHISFIRRGLDAGKLMPNDSFHREGDGAVLDPRKGLWHPVAALWAWQADAAPHALWRALPGVTVFFALIVFWLFAGELVGPVPMRLLALAFLLLFFRGEGLGWMAKIGYSRNIAQIAAWGTIAFLIRYLRTSRRLHLATVAVVAPAGAAIHLEFAAVIGVAVLSLMIFALVSRAGRGRLGRVAVAAPLVLAALALPTAVRILHAPSEVNLIHAHTQGMLELGRGLRVVDPAELIARFDLAFLFALALAPFFFLIAPKGERTVLTGTLFVVPAALVVNPLTATFLEREAGYFHIRLLAAAPVACFLALAVAGLARVLVFGRSGAAARSRSAVAPWIARAFAAAALACFFLVVMQPAAKRFAGDVMKFALRDSETEGNGERMARILSRLPERSVIATDPATSYLVSAFTDHFVVVTLGQHCSPADTGALERNRMARELFCPCYPLERSAAWLESKGVEYVVIDRRAFRTPDFFGVTAFLDPDDVVAKLRSHPEMLREVSSAEGVHIFSVSDDILPRSGSSETMRPAQTDSACARRSRRGIELPGADGVIFEGIGPQDATLAAGDTLKFDLFWSVHEALEFELPLYWTLRFDTQFPRGSFYREWYGKQYRRTIERRNNTLYRFTVSDRVAAGAAFPDAWEPGACLRQEVSVVAPRGLAPGRYTVRLTVSRRAYLPNRTMSDYLRNDDSFHGRPIGTFTIVAAGTPDSDG